MGYLSQQGQLIMRTQAVAGTYQADTGSAGMQIRTRSGSLAPNRSLLIPDPEIGGSRDVPDAYLGSVSYSGTFDAYIRMQMVAALLKWVLGSNASVALSTTTPATHTATPAAVLPWISVEHAIAQNFDCYQYTDVKMNTLHLEAAADGFLMATFGLVARILKDNQTRTASPTTDVTPMVVGTNVTLSYNGVSLPAKSFSIDINNNLETDDFRLGSLVLGDVTEKRREVTMAATLRPADAAIWRTATLGSGATTDPTGLTDKQQLIISMSAYELVPGVTTPPAPYSVTITVPKVAIQPFAIAPSGDDVIQEDITMQALQPNPATPIMTAVTKNELATLP